jgi:hypothetical protein
MLLSKQLKPLVGREDVAAVGEPLAGEIKRLETALERSGE